MPLEIGLACLSVAQLKNSTILPGSASGMDYSHGAAAMMALKPDTGVGFGTTFHIASTSPGIKDPP